MTTTWTGRSITQLSLHRRRTNPGGFGYGLEHIPFLLLHAYNLYWCFLTIGDPYALALKELEEQGFNLDRILNPPSEDEMGGLAGSALMNSGSTDAPVNPTDDKSIPPLPNPFLPAIIPLLCFVFVLCLHILMRLLQIWSTRVLTFIKYNSAANLADATFVKVVPRAYRGKSVMVELEQHILSNGEKSAPFFMFQKRKYVGEITADGVCFRKLKAPVTNNVESYIRATGIDAGADYTRKLDLYGQNEFSIPQPTFIKMFQEQLVEPLTVFQIFSVCLYMLDEYWQYSLFTLVMILMFEGVTVFSRLKNLQTLRGMGNVPRDIYVYRSGKWTQVSTTSLVPGDIISIKRIVEGDSTVPCDCLLLQGNAVANEATLTGESVPQMKEAIGVKANAEDLSSALDMKSGHKVHILFGGTTIMQHDAGTPSTPLPKQAAIPATPDKGCLAYVLRTGFSASQGKLVRMIEFSSGKVTGNTWDAVGLAVLLLFFAIMSSGYVLREGIARKGRVTFELVLRCVLIITSVVPAELPMQTAMAVNTALLALVRLSIFCTEPFRISLAGKVDICLFDKTGTITTDQLTAVGVTSYDESLPMTSEIQPHKPMLQSHVNSCLVLAGCHSLVEIDGKMIGDPVEEASLRAIDFTYDPKAKTCAPNSNSADRPELKGCKVQILHRNHFASKLQRMSVVARCQFAGHTRMRVLVKGSPEALSKLTTSLPDWFWPTYQDMARKGMRVLALAYRDCENISEGELPHKTREWAESNLKFAGFAAYQCLVRRDSAEILQQLKDSSHKVSMITGDATLTAVHVAKEVGILSRPSLILSGSDSLFEWKTAEEDKAIAVYSKAKLVEISKTYDLCMDGAALLRADEIDGGVWKNLDLIRVYARMTPELKERVLTSLKSCGHHTLMCGDGANDVGALKQAHVGVALLSGFGSANADKSITGADALKKSKKPIEVETLSREGLIKLHASVLKKKLVALNIPHDNVTEKSALIALLLEDQEKKQANNPAMPLNPFAMTPEQRKEYQRKQQEEIEVDVREREARGESFARFKALAAFAKRQKDQAAAFQAQQKAKGGSGFANFTNNQVMAQYMDDFDDGELPMVKLGDASIASPFTSRAPSIKGCVDIIRQGRCALVTTVQMYQILAVNCLISSYSLSVLYLDKVKYANSQMIALGMMSTVASVTLSRATPLPDLSPVRPISTIFHPALFSSLIGQFALHLAVMVYSTNLAKEYTPVDDTRHMTDIKPLVFEPNVMSTVIFLVNGVQTISVCAVNYKGRPFMKSMTDNPGLLYSLGISLVGVFLLCTEAMPLFNKVLEIVPMPDPRFAQILTGILTLDVVGAFVWDQLCLLIFAPHIFVASFKSISRKDVRQLIKMLVIALVVIYVVANIDYDEIERQQKLMEAQAQNVTQPDFVEAINFYQANNIIEGEYLPFNHLSSPFTDMKWWSLLGLFNLAFGNVFESDHRVPVNSFPVPLPFTKMVGKVILGQNGLCTGFIVGPSHVLTVGSCVFNSDPTVKQMAKQHLSFSLNGENALVVQIYQAYDGNDYVLLQLDKDFGNQYGTLPLIGSPSCNITFATPSLNVFSVQYARPLFENEAGIQSNCKLNVTGSAKCFHSCDTSAIGSTGTPLLYSIRNGTSVVTCVVAMHQGGIDEKPLNANGDHVVQTYSNKTANIGVIVAMANVQLSSLLASQVTTPPPTTASPTTPLPTTTQPTTMAPSTTDSSNIISPAVENNDATSSPTSESSSSSSSVNTTTIVYICITVVIVVWIIVLGCIIRRRLLQRSDLLTPA
ncbi:P-type ATPase (P-ATPase) Superfamily [Thraustotheca clavata]|uniref:P-type ATPase (P-ATPase) Superfamily n=1 Tax=Thraustotheca clavata TaxID=74557 RepID=A0A1V9ZGR5_9STRA|nr:P-type ATPase (P-ATPase) Superfamily [Thraustotheca clavata]